jgi:serine O-acetyltransferase
MEDVPPLDSRRLWLDMLRLAWVSDDFIGVALYRVRVSLSRRGVPLLPRLLDKLCTWFFGIRLGPYVVVREGLYLPHGNVVADGPVYIGQNCSIAPWVTLGLVQGSFLGPTLEDGVMVGTGAKILGPVRIGTCARVGANAVVLRDVPPFASVVGSPARVVSDDWRRTELDPRWSRTREHELVFGTGEQGSGEEPAS